MNESYTGQDFSVDQDNRDLVHKTDNYRSARDAAFRESQSLIDEARVLEIDAAAKREKAAHIVAELNQPVGENP